MGNVHMEATQINYRGGDKKMSVEEALKNTSGEAEAIAQLQEDVGDLQDGVEDLDAAVKLNTQDLTTTSRTKNILPITVAGVKVANNTGTWAGNAYTMNGVTFTLNTDAGGNITSVTATGTATDDAILYAGECAISAPVIASGSPASGSDETYYTVCNVGGWYAENREYGSGKTFTSGTITNAALVVSVGYEIPEGGIVFYPMIRLSTETNATFAPYIPSVESRIEAVESKISSYVIVRSYSHLCSLVETNASYEFDIEPDTINGYTALLAVYGANDKTSALLPFINSDATLSVGGKFTLGVRNTTVNDIANANLIYYIVYVKS